MVYRFIDENKFEFGLRWLIRRCGLSMNSYYNYLKNRKEAYYKQLDVILEEIKMIYYNNGRLLGYRGMRIFLARKGIVLSTTTVHKYMNKILKLYAVTSPKRAKYSKGIIHKVYENELQQNFDVETKNQVWCTDFTYIKLKNGKMRYNCSIIDLYDRSIVASLNSKYINTELAISVLEKALKNENIKNPLKLHSDQGSQFTSYDFTNYCKEHNIVQSMSKSGCPYDNAVMERFYKTFKNEFVYQNTFIDEADLDVKTRQYIYLWYNYLRPHSYNDGLTPMEKRNIV